jgi:ABC-type bacteriocin/lantibiotic exporter with double-glycine peptidase domain
MRAGRNEHYMILLMPMLRRAALAATVLLGRLAMAQDPYAHTMWRTPMACGANCVFLLVHAHGIPAAYERVLDVVGTTPRGSTLQDLERACREIGLPVAAASGTPSAFGSLALPIVVHLDHWTGSVDRIGHYVLLESYDEGAGVVEYLDPISLLRCRATIDAFRRQWSGFALVPERGSRVLPIAGLMLLAGFAFGSAVRYLIRR